MGKAVLFFGHELKECGLFVCHDLLSPTQGWYYFGRALHALPVGTKGLG